MSPHGMMGMGGGATYGTFALGRLTYRTANEARGAARDLGIGGVHEHQQGGETVFMPGSDCAELNSGLEANGLPPAEPCGSGGGMGSAGFMGSHAANDDVDFGADIPTMEEMDESDEWGF